jgi:cytoskeleton protein RodZ
MTNFGASLKQARESKGISLEQIAAETRISTRFLRAIENEEFKLLPGGIFNKGFVRAFAEKVGLNPDEAVADYERLIGSHHPVEAAATPPQTPTPAPPPQTTRIKKQQRYLYPIALAALIIVIAVFYIVNRESGRTAQTASAPAQPQVTTAPAPVPPPQNAPATEPSTSAKTPEPEVTQPPPPPPPVPVSQSLTLEIEAREQTWIKVVSDGNTVNPGEILQPGMARKFTAQSSLRLSVGNAAGLNLKLNDKSMKPLGKSGQVREVTITPATAIDFIG